MENATPWQVFDALRLACLDYVMAVEHFGLRSTLFFGKDWWPLHYAYDYDYINTARTLPPEDAGKDATRVRAAIEAARVKTAAYTDHAHAKAQIEEAQGSGINNFLTPSDENTERGASLSPPSVPPGPRLPLRHEPDRRRDRLPPPKGWHRAVQATGSYAGTLESQQVETSLVQYVDTRHLPSVPEHEARAVRTVLHRAHAPAGDHRRERPERRPRQLMNPPTS